MAPRGWSPDPGLQSLEMEGAPCPPPWSSECQRHSHCQSLPQAAWPPSKQAKGTDGAAPAPQPSNLERRGEAPSCSCDREDPHPGSRTKAGAGQQLHSPLLLLRRKHAGPQVLPPLLPSPYSLTSAGPVRDTRICTPGMQGLEESSKILTKYLPTKETRDQRKKKRLLTGVGEAGSVPGLPLCKAWESKGNSPTPGTLHPKQGTNSARGIGDVR